MSNLSPGNIVLISGQNGSGRTTTIARLITGMKNDTNIQIAMLEQSPEFDFNIESLIITRFEKSDTNEPALAAIRAINPEVVVIDSLDTYQDFLAALTLAEGGAYIIALTRASSTIENLMRLIELAPDHEADKIRSRFSTTFGASVIQKMLRKKDNTESIIATEVCIANPATRSLIRENKLYQITAQIQVGAKQHMKLMANAIHDLIKEGTITRQEALRGETYPEQLLTLIDREEAQAKEEKNIPEQSSGDVEK
jgi:twitching motility protein PilT